MNLFPPTPNDVGALVVVLQSSAMNDLRRSTKTRTQWWSCRILRVVSVSPDGVLCARDPLAPDADVPLVPADAHVFVLPSAFSAVFHAEQKAAVLARATYDVFSEAEKKIRRKGEALLSLAEMARHTDGARTHMVGKAAGYIGAAAMLKTWQRSEP